MYQTRPTLVVISSIVVEHCISESLCIEYRKPHTISSQFNCGTSVTFLKVYVSSTERFAVRQTELKV